MLAGPPSQTSRIDKEEEQDLGQPGFKGHPIEFMIILGFFLVIFLSREVA